MPQELMGQRSQFIMLPHSNWTVQLPFCAKVAVTGMTGTPRTRSGSMMNCDLIMREEKPLERKVTIRNDRLQKYFPASYTPKQMEDVIIKLLEGWHRKRQQEQAR